MSVYDLGAPVKSVWMGAPVAGPYSVAITRPDDTAFTPPAIASDPEPSVTFVPDMAGRWRLRWLATGTEKGAYSDVVDVWPTDPKFIISLDDAKAALNLPYGTPPAKLQDLRLYIAAATPVIEDIVGPVSVRTETQHVAQGWRYAALSYKPATITSVVYDDMSTVLASLYEVDLPAGLLTFKAPLAQGATITYTTGTALVPQNVRLATRELVRHWWQQGQQGSLSRRGGVSPAEEAYTPQGFAVPKRVIEQCGPNKQIGGFG